MTPLTQTILGETAYIGSLAMVVLIMNELTQYAEGTPENEKLKEATETIRTVSSTLFDKLDNQALKE